MKRERWIILPEKKKIPVAAALKYNPEKERAPRLIAAARGEQAEKIKELAREAGIPETEDSILSEILSRMVPGREIPEELYPAVAAVYLFLKELDEQSHSPETVG